MQDSPEIQRLTKLLAQFPGLGPRSAKRMILHMLSHKENLMTPLASAIEKAARAIVTCETCGNLDITSPCSICNDERRDSSAICVVQSVADIWALERTRAYSGKYHVLGGLLSALDGIRPSDLSIGPLTERAHKDGVEEIIIALSATVDGQSTAHYIQTQLKDAEGLSITKLAHGVPIGGELDYLDDGTLSLALKSRR